MYKRVERESLRPPHSTRFSFEASRAFDGRAAPRDPAQALKPDAGSFINRPTLSQMWPEREAGPPFTFKISMLHVFCSSHGLAHFAALFIDPRAK